MAYFRSSLVIPARIPALAALEGPEIGQTVGVAAASGFSVLLSDRNGLRLLLAIGFLRLLTPYLCFHLKASF
jgi:hypothetical protein